MQSPPPPPSHLPQVLLCTPKLKNKPVHMANLLDQIRSHDSTQLSPQRTFVKMKDQTICVQVDGKYFKWMASKNDPESGTIGEEYRPSRGIVLMGTAEAARNPKLFPIDSEDLTIRVFIGSQDAAANFDGMKEMSITLVLNVATGVSVMHNDSIRYVEKPMLDEPNFQIVSLLEECCNLIEKEMETGGSVLVHCNQGVSRSAAVCIAYLMRRKNLSFEQALNRVKQSKADIRPNEGFTEQLKKEWGKKITNKKKT